MALALGVTPAELDDRDAILPGVRRGCDSYVSQVREATLLETVAASLTEFFAPDLMQRRLAAWQQHYPFVEATDETLPGSQGAAGPAHPDRTARLGWRLTGVRLAATLFVPPLAGLIAERIYALFAVR